MVVQAGKWRAALQLLDLARARQAPGQEEGGCEEQQAALLSAAVDVCVEQGKVGGSAARV